jgi:hypothetical protein
MNTKQLNIYLFIYYLRYSCESDYFSIGLLMYELVTSRNPINEKGGKINIYNQIKVIISNLFLINYYMNLSRIFLNI